MRNYITTWFNMLENILHIFESNIMVVLAYDKLVITLSLL